MRDERDDFESLFKSVFINKYPLSRTYTGYENSFVNCCFFFWQTGFQKVANDGFITAKHPGFCATERASQRG